ncbi:MAG: hypothetical protein LQ349_000897 [Xanthoria aureola]|nr:MAG: hypothetical protein LQ349_000897 [Xanthoria aureola]
MAEYPSEKRPSTTGRDYEGLELDTRAGDGAEKHLDHTKPLPDLKRWQDEEENKRYLNEKQMIDAHEVPQSSPTTDTSMGALSPRAPHPKGFDHPVGSPPEPRTRRICGLRRGLFWLMFGVVLALVIVAAVVGGVVGGTRHSPKPSAAPASNATAVPANSNRPVEPGDVTTGSPLNVVSYSGPNNQQIFRVYFQSALGNIKEAVSDRNLDAWGPARPIFTDAVNHTGLATVTYVNGSAQTGQMFYVGTNGYIQEKRKALDDNETFWQPGGFNKIGIKLAGNITLPKKVQNLDPINQFDGYNMAAVYSDIFANGAGTRFFYHQSSSNGTNWVQEWIWTRETDNWKIGQAIPNVYPNSHIAATVDEQNRLLRLYFSVGNLTLQESYLNISDPQGLYNNGFTLTNLLPQNNADLAVTSDNGTIYIYHPSNIGEIGIRELKVTGVPGGGLLSNFPQESFNLSEALAASPSLTSLEGTSPYSPIAASVTRAQSPKVPKSVFVFFAETVVGSRPASEDSVSGYRNLQQVSRDLVIPAWTAANPRSIPLGSDNTFPEPEDSKSKRSLRWLR